MGDLAVDTAIEPIGAGRYRASLTRDWEIWGPMGGYVASFAMRAIGAEATFTRPVSFFCHYLGVARFDDPIEIEVTKIRGGRNTESFRASITQGERQILEATVWTVGEVEGLKHDFADAPIVPGPDQLKTFQELMPDEDAPVIYKFWENFDPRPLQWRKEWPPDGPLPPVWRQWERFVPTATFDDPWIDACRTLILVDVVSWPAATGPHAHNWPNGQEWIAPSLDLYVAFHEPQPESEWLLVDGHSSFAGDGLIAWTGKLWSESRRLIASGTGQLLCRRIPVGSQ